MRLLLADNRFALDGDLLSKFNTKPRQKMITHTVINNTRYCIGTY